MSCQITSPRQELKRISDLKKRKLSIDDSDEISLNRNLDSELEVVEESQISLKGHRDLFGELIPYNTVKKIETKNKSVKKTPVTKKKKEVSNNQIIIPQRVFIPSPNIMKMMREAQEELYDIMGMQTSSSNVPVVKTNNDLNVSGIQKLQNSPSTSIRNEAKTNANNNDDTNSRQILEGVVGFVDYKFENDRSGSSIIQRLLELGAKVEKTFTRKVTHVVFCDGYRTTYNKANELGVPLVSARWIEYSALAKKILDPLDYLPKDLEKYKNPPKIKYLDIKASDKYKKYLSPSNAINDQLFKDTCDNLMKRFHDIKEQTYKKTEHGPIIETPKNTTVNQKDDSCKNDLLNTLSDKLYTVLNKSNSPVPDDQIDELCIPMPIKVLRKCLTPSGVNNTPKELNSELVKIENRLNLNYQARKRFRQILFPSDKDSNNVSNITDFPSPSPQELRNSAPSRLISRKKKKTVIDNKLLPNTNKVDNNKRTPPEKNTQNNLLKLEIHSDLRPKKIRKPTVQKVKNVKKTQSQNTVSSMISRNSSKIFQTPKASLVLQSIACTGMTKHEVNILKSSILNLGYNFHTKVEPLTTYLVTKPQPNQTLNAIFAMAYGCFIVSEDWVHESLKVGRWLSHEQYLISDLSEPVKAFQMRRHTFGSSLTFHIFHNVGRIYISDTCEPPAKLLRRLVRACGGHCTSTETNADVAVGYTQQMNNNIHEKWILDSITQGILLNKYQYMLTNTNKK